MSSYVVLARKWRPQRFDDLTGQGHVAQTLKNALEQGRVPHALLFTGARGVGKTSCARILAMALNCQRGPTTEPCGECDACQEIQRGQSVDVLEIDGASNRGINEIRELRDGVRYAPNRDRYKVYIIDEVHMLTTEAFNALLKTLEEPPKHVIFIFATTEAQKIPVTILSRCQRFDFRRIPHAEIVARLSTIAVAEGMEIDPEVLGIVARQAAGGMRDALSQLDQVIAFAGMKVMLSDAEAILGAAERRRLFELSDAVLRRDVEQALKIVDEIDSFGVDVSHFAIDLVSHLRDLAIVAVSSDPAALTTLTDGELADARAQVKRTDVSTLHRMFELMVDSAEGIARSNHPKLLFEMALVKLAAIEPVHSLAGLIERLEALADGRRLPAGPTGGGSAGGGTTTNGAAVGGANGDTNNTGDTGDTTASGAASEASPVASPRTPALDTAPRAAAPEPPEPAAAPEPQKPAPVAAESRAVVAATPAAEPEAAVPPVDIEPDAADTGPDAADTGPDAADTGPDAAEIDSAEVAELHSTLSTVASLAPTTLTEETWTYMVTTLRAETPHAGELLAGARACVAERSVTLAFADALLGNVPAELLTRLNRLNEQLGGATLDFRAVSEKNVPPETLDASFHVAGRERAARLALEKAARQYVTEHSATALLMSTFPGSELVRIEVPEAPTEASQ